MPALVTDSPKRSHPPPISGPFSIHISGRGGALAGQGAGGPGRGAGDLSPLTLKVLSKTRLLRKMGVAWGLLITKKTQKTCSFLTRHPESSCLSRIYQTLDHCTVHHCGGPLLVGGHILFPYVLTSCSVVKHNPPPPRKSTRQPKRPTLFSGFHVDPPD